ncbi:uncharacterized protein LOC117124625 [Anneissia japonica]|uniref:uncharacterized protein LOC117124625 n=1 Tax=Anneissia japonica TaxID=1529436 RepID=UPI001425A3E9|nr:uncharacterized protein LOC117124625 [Anneissia japonica]
MSSVENHLNKLAFTMKDVPVNMRLFSLCMRSLYAEKALGESSDTAKKINKIRDDTRKDALVYVKYVLPASTELVRNLKEFFEYYENLSLEDWREYLPRILEEVRGYKQCCVEIINLHEKIMIPLKKREDEAKVLIEELKNLTEVLKRKKAELEKSASTKKSWATWLAFVPGVDAIAVPLLKMRADSDLAESVAKEAQCSINESSIVVVSKTMIPALAAFIEGLEGIAGFFQVVEQEITTFQNKGEKALEKPIEMHYKMMESKAKEIKQRCTEFFAMIPGVRTDFLCIPETGRDKNYVEIWLKKQQEEIEKRYAKSFTGQLRKLLTNLSTDEGEKLMTKGKD